MKKLVALAFLVSLSITAYCQKFEGKLKYSVALKGANAAAMQAYLPKSIDYTFKGDKVRMDGGDGPMAMNMIVKDGYTYIMNKQKKEAMKMKNGAKKTADAATKPKVTATSETATIAGYKCKKYAVVTKDPATGNQPTTTYVWATSDLDIKMPEFDNYSALTKDIAGTPLKISMSLMGMDFNLEATEVKKEKVADSAFDVPKDYTVKETTAEELRNKMMGGMGQ